MPLPKKHEPFSQIFSAFPKSISNFKYISKNDDPQSLCIFRNTDCQRRG